MFSLLLGLGFRKLSFALSRSTLFFRSVLCVCVCLLFRVLFRIMRLFESLSFLFLQM